MTTRTCPKCLKFHSFDAEASSGLAHCPEHPGYWFIPPEPSDLIEVFVPGQNATTPAPTAPRPAPASKKPSHLATLCILFWGRAKAAVSSMADETSPSIGKEVIWVLCLLALILAGLLLAYLGWT